MAKLNRSTLKEIVKECLVELLAEGLTGGNTKSLTESIENRSTQGQIPRSIQKMMPPKNKVKNKRFDENVNHVVSQATNDPVLSSILADTAKTTLQEQNSAESSNKFIGKPTDEASQIVSQSDPLELFGESSTNWAQLAFSENKK